MVPAELFTSGAIWICGFGLTLILFMAPSKHSRKTKKDTKMTRKDSRKVSSVIWSD